MPVCRNNRWGDRAIAATSRPGGTRPVDVDDSARPVLLVFTNATPAAISTATPTADWRTTLNAGRRPILTARCGMRAFSVATATASGMTKKRALTYQIGRASCRGKSVDLGG